MVGIDNAITLSQAAGAGDARDTICAAFQRDAVRAADGLLVETCPGGLGVLSGMVRSWAAYDHAVTTAWSAPGVTEVDDRIRVENVPKPRTWQGQP